ncbi:hypothetical protein QE152_g7073 [Popillia japonica]|uniref:Uncharacterized protein n=1 Tax=Popillia japonica TaxID=7064 RepID=A0AAW1MFX7_POPJA
MCQLDDEFEKGSKRSKKTAIGCCGKTESKKTRWKGHRDKTTMCQLDDEFDTGAGDPPTTRNNRANYFVHFHLGLRHWTRRSVFSTRICHRPRDLSANT